MIIVRDPNEATLIGSGTLPSAANTLPVVLSDITVCKAPASGSSPSANDAATYDPSLPWVGGGSLPVQPGPTPKALCEDSAIDDNGNARAPYAAGDVPSIQRPGTSGRTNEGQTVLTNGVDVAAGAFTKDVAAGQGLRLQLLNAAAILPPPSD